MIRSLIQLENLREQERILVSMIARNQGKVAHVPADYREQFQNYVNFQMDALCAVRFEIATILIANVIENVGGAE